MNIQLDDVSPQIAYYAAAGSASGWIVDHTSDKASMVSSYSKGTFHGTYGDGDYMVYKFNGSGVAIYGAKRDNHGIYGVSVDGGDVLMSDGYSATTLFKQVLFSRNGLDDSEHTVTITNYPNAGTSAVAGNHWLDIDYIQSTPPSSTLLFPETDFVSQATSSTSGQVYTTMIDDANPVITYTSWSTYVDSNRNVAFFNLTDHTTSTEGSIMTVPFTGSSIQLIASLNDVHGNYSVSLDGAEAEVFNSNFFTPIYQVPIYTASGLDEGDHTVTVTNLGSGTRSILSFDYAMVNSTSPPASSTSAIVASTLASTAVGSDSTTSNGAGTASSSTSSSSSSAVVAGASEDTNGGSKTNVGAISGGVAGGVVALALLAVLAFWFFRRRRNSASSSQFSEDGSREGSYFDYAPGPAGAHSRKTTPSSRNMVDLGSSRGSAGRHTPRSMLWSGGTPRTPVTPFVDHPNQPQQHSYDERSYHPPPSSGGSSSGGGTFLYNSSAPLSPGSQDATLVSNATANSPFFPSMPPPPGSNTSSYPRSAHQSSRGAMPATFTPFTGTGGASETLMQQGQGVGPATVSTAQLSEKSRPGTGGSGGAPTLPRMNSMGSFSALSHFTAEQAGGDRQPPEYVQAVQPRGQH
ncbi:hypothetical protein L198_02075 [Cryptococcus wingfieldii CBS 7118]|uniref:Transmembrane protein n=1 Tax=Cryptococcus wingfieldii CBS 7118 TaxID=1295528 RepID=A0A1E3JZQ6_9TREE|nr:hypothetical protein L198_02075 [Cryptococcus wingfieldii CBS 7118]ODO05382.1 hypothetical protein L198_02075 [Cryptococcus wingfieldii CBS 7118]